jgi:signal transduction histidine kinase
MNKGALEFTGLDDVVSSIGKRPGELIGCIHSDEEEGGCGTSESCTYCGAINAVLESQKGKNAVRDCRLILGPEEKAFDLRVWASQLQIENQEFTAITIQDISDEKRREALERIFFHDILNTSSALLSTFEILKNYSNKVDQDEFMNKLDYIIKSLIEEIQANRMLTAAEKKELELEYTSFNSLDVIKELVDLYKNQKLSKRKIIKLDPDIESTNITLDRNILYRVLGNMIKNALEATSEGEVITIGCKIKNNKINYWVQNPGYIPRNIQLQIFQRSFSTKGKNRGLGTYSMKLLSSLLGGKVEFSTSKEQGTIFRAIFSLK